jgi:uncharacterized protein YbjQ (UPF0145 family)
MTRRLIFASLLACFTLCAQAADTFFAYSELLSSSNVKEFIKPDVKLYWGSEASPEFAEVARPDTYTRISVSLSPFGGSKRHCVDAFEKALKATIDDAASRGYDAVINIRPVVDGKPSDDPKGFNCNPGYKTTNVSLMSSFAMTGAAIKRMNEAEQQSTKLPPRSPIADAIFISLEPILASVEAKAILGSTLSAFAGTKAPAYLHRYGPDEYSDEADSRTQPKEAACQQAVLKVLRAMADDAKAKGFDSIIKIRSYLNSQYAPVTNDVECLIGKKAASVTLVASFASKQ